MEAFLREHDYVSASPALDAAMKRMHEENNDAAFRDLICTFVTEACRDSVRLYCPTDRSDNNNPLIFQYGDTQLYAFYTDREAALACARGSMAPNRAALYAGIGSMALGTIIERAQSGAILAFNLGLPSEIILPMNIHHTVHHLMITLKCKTKEPQGSAWGEWIGLLEGFVAAGKDKKACDETVHTGDVTMRIPVTPPPGGRGVYRLG